jgi:replicative superfamily II helicase
VFHTLYHTDHNVLLGAPTGSGKTIVAELAMFNLFNNHPGKKVVYIAPLKALARERIADWSREESFKGKLKKNIVELTGDVTPDAKVLADSDIIITTPEKWDGVSRQWQSRGYVRMVGLLIIDEIHLLGADRGPILEVIISRMRSVLLFCFCMSPCELILFFSVADTSHHTPRPTFALSVCRRPWQTRTILETG